MAARVTYRVGQAGADQGVCHLELRPDAADMDDFAGLPDCPWDEDRKGGPGRRLRPVAGASAGRDADRWGDPRKEEDHDYRLAGGRGFLSEGDRDYQLAKGVAVAWRGGPVRQQQVFARQAGRALVEREPEDAEPA